MFTALSLLVSQVLCCSQFDKQSFVFSSESFMTVLIRAMEHIPDLLLVDLCPFFSIFFFKLIQAVSLLFCCATWTCSFHFILGIPLQSSIVGDLCPQHRQIRSDGNPESQTLLAREIVSREGCNLKLFFAFYELQFLMKI